MALSDHATARAGPAGWIVDRLRGASRLLGTSAFKVVAIVVAMFALAAAAVFGTLFWQTNDMLTRQVLRGLGLERAAFADIVRSGGPVALQRAVEARAGPLLPGASLLLLQDASLTKRL